MATKKPNKSKLPLTPENMVKEVKRIVTNRELSIDEHPWEYHKTFLETAYFGYLFTGRRVEAIGVLARLNHLAENN